MVKCAAIREKEGSIVMISDLCKLARVAFAPIHGHASNGDQLRHKLRSSRTNALLGQGNVPVSHGYVLTSRDVRRMKTKVLSHVFRP